MADILQSPGNIPHGIYRIRNAGRVAPNLYLQWESNFTITLQPLDTTNTKQQWTITAQADDVYIIANVYSPESALCIIDYDEGGASKQRLGAGNGQRFTVEPREAEQWIIGVIDNGTCIDLPDNSVPIIWERNNRINQRWILELVERLDGSAAITSGVYTITNRGSTAQLVAYDGRDKRVCPARVYAAEPDNRDHRWNIVQYSWGGFEITYTLVPTASIRWLQDQDGGPVITPEQNICRLVHVSNTQYFHIALGPDSNARYLMDPNGSHQGSPSTSSIFDAHDQRQQWYLTKYEPGYSH